MDKNVILKVEDKLPMALSAPKPDPAFVSSLRIRLHAADFDNTTHRLSSLKRIQFDLGFVCLRF